MAFAGTREIVHVSTQWYASFNWAELACGGVVVWPTDLYKCTQLEVYSTQTPTRVALLPLATRLVTTPCVAASRNLMIAACTENVYVYGGGPAWTRVIKPTGLRLSTLRRIDFFKDESGLFVSSRYGWFTMSLGGKVTASMTVKRLQSILGFEDNLYPICHTFLDSSTVVLLVRANTISSVMVVWDLGHDDGRLLVDCEHSPHTGAILVGIDSLEDGRLVSYCTDKLIVWRPYAKDTWQWDPRHCKENVVDTAKGYAFVMACARDGFILAASLDGTLFILQARTNDLVFCAVFDTGIQETKCFYRQGVEDVFYLDDLSGRRWLKLARVGRSTEWEITPLPKPVCFERFICPLLSPARPKTMLHWDGDETRTSLGVWQGACFVLLVYLMMPRQSIDYSKYTKN